LGSGSSALGDAVARPRDDRQKDLLRPALEEIIDLGHPLVRLAGEIDWGFLDRRFASVCTPGPGQPGRLDPFRPFGYYRSAAPLVGSVSCAILLN
jgi:hypothetical protein